MPLTQPDAELRPIATERIAEGRLPSAPPERIWGGRGAGEICALCDKPILADEVEYELEAYANGAKQAFRFHILCQSVWQLACAPDDCLKKQP
jgi:hypothetical protein